MTEIFRCYDISTVSGKNSSADSKRGYEPDHFSVCVRQGEILGIFGNHYAGKHQIIALLTGRLAPERGLLFFEEQEKSAAEYAELAARKVLFVARESRLSDGMSVEENVEILWSIHGNVRSRNGYKRRKLIRVMLQEYGFEKPPQMRVRGLNEMEKMRLEAIAGLQKQTRLLCVDFSGVKRSDEEIRKWKQLLWQFSQRGMGVILFDHQLSDLQIWADQIAFLYRGKILKVMENLPGQKAKTEQAMRALFPERNTQNYQKSRDRKGKELLNIRKLALGKEQYLTMPVREGEFSVIYCSDPDTLSRLQNELCGAGREVPRTGEAVSCKFTDIRFIDSIIPDLSPLDNCCLGLLQRFSVLGFTKRSVIQFIQKDFAEWYGDDGLLARPNSHGLSCKERVALNLYRMRLIRPQILFCTDIYLQSDLNAIRLVHNQLLEFLEEGVAVCMLTTDYNFSGSMVDHYVRLEEGWGQDG